MPFGAEEFEKIYHHHIMKCAGTTINRLLDMQVPAARAFSPILPETIHEINTAIQVDYPEIDTNSMSYDMLRFNRYYQHVCDRYDVLHDHTAMQPFLCGKVFRFTMLRDPAERVLSQFRYCRSNARRLLALDPNTQLPELYQVCLFGDEETFIQNFNREQRFAELDNFIVRSYAAATLSQSLACTLSISTKALLPYAIRNLVNGFELVAMQESFDEAIAALCEELGICPQLPLGKSNPTVMHTTRTAPPSLAVLKQKLSDDYALYEVAAELWANYQREHRPKYDLADFENHFLSQRLANLTPEFNGDGWYYNINQPIIGYGFWGRECAGEPHCATWTGPGTRSGLYFPAPRGEQVQLVIGINGFAAERLQQHMQFFVNGQPKPFRFYWKEKRFVVEIDCVPVRDYVHVSWELIGTETLGTDEPRELGFLLGSYGWKPRYV